VLLLSQPWKLAPRDARALAFACQAVQAVAAKATPTDITLQGSINFTAGGDQESGTFTLEAKGNQESKLVLALSGGTRQEIRNAVAGRRGDSSSPKDADGDTGATAGVWSGPDGARHAMALHNCWTDASWLLPVFTLQAALSNPQVAAVYLGQANANGVVADHLQLSYVVAGQSPAMTSEIQALSAMDIYLDAASHLPVALTFNTHPDNDLNVNIPVEIIFSGYQKLGGILVPTRVQKLLQGTLTLDMTVSGVAVNSGIPDSEFNTN